MVSAETKSVIDRAKQIYVNQLQRDLEAKHMDRFVAIEPQSGEYFVGVRRGGESRQDEVSVSSVAHHQDRAAGSVPHGRLAAVKGFVDDKLRALLRVPVCASRDAERSDMLVWIDTAFNGGLVIPRKQIAHLGLAKESSAEALLADGKSVELETLVCVLDWFGNSYETQIVANDGEYPLLGTMLLDGHRLDIDSECGSW